MDAAVPYQALAPYYNRVMSHVDYPGWARYLRAAWRKYHGVKPPERVLEIAAGTCPFAFLPLFPKAFTVYTDRSSAMLSVGAGFVGAGHFPPLQNPPPPRLACDARALALRGPFDLAIMIYDSLNYLLLPEDIVCALREARQALRPKGLFIFDVATETCSRRYFADSIDFEELDGCASIRASRYDARRRVQLNLFTLFVAGPDGRYDRREEVHRQRIHSLATLRKLARRAGFSVLACLADFTFKPGSERNERIHFVLQRP